MTRGVFCFAVIANCWLWMQIIHELGHVAATFFLGDQVELVYLVPWDISRTDFHAPQLELPIVWAGPLFGAIVPAFGWLASRLLKSSKEPLAAFFTGFCLIANGAYLGASVFFAGRRCRGDFEVGRSDLAASPNRRDLSAARL